jgi:hypothetical protein
MPNLQKYVMPYQNGIILLLKTSNKNIVLVQHPACCKLDNRSVLEWHSEIYTRKKGHICMTLGTEISEKISM